MGSPPTESGRGLLLARPSLRDVSVTGPIWSLPVPTAFSLCTHVETCYSARMGLGIAALHAYRRNPTAYWAAFSSHFLHLWTFGEVPQWQAFSPTVFEQSLRSPRLA